MSRGGYDSQRGGGFRGGSRGNSRGGFGGGNRYADNGPPAEIVEMGAFLHDCESEMVCKSINEKIPYFNAPIFLANKTQIGKVDEILGPINEMCFTVKMQDGMVAASFKSGDKVFIGTDKLLPLDRFLPKPKVAKVKTPKGPRDASRGGSRGGRGFSRGGRGGPVRGGRGGGFSRGRGSSGGRGGFSRGRGGY